MKLKTVVYAALLYFWMAAGAQAGPVLVYSGNFTQDDNVVTIPIIVSTAGPFTATTYSYAGGVTSTGQTVVRGGFDPVLALFDSSNLVIGINDNGATVPADTSGSGFAWDAQLDFVFLAPGNYLLTLTQANNFPNGPLLSDGFARAGEGNFTGMDQGLPQASFLDISGDQRSSAWALEVIGADGPSGGSQAPEPSTGLMVVAAAGALFVCAKRRHASVIPVLALAAVAAPHALAASIPVAADATLRQSQPAQNFGTLPQLTVDAANSALLSFDLAAALPQGTTFAQIADARLVLFVNRTLTPGAIRMNAVCGQWSESAVTFSTPLSSCSSDYPAAVSGSSNFLIMDVTKIVQLWLASNGSQTGILVSSAGGAAIFDSKENTVSSQHARLEITLTGPRGPQGKIGPPGPQGPPGPIGPNTLPASQCGSGLAVGINANGTLACTCPAAPYIPTVTATVSGLFDTQSWPGGRLTMGSGPCTMTIDAPSGRIDATASHSGWSVVNTGPYSACQVIGRKPDCNTVAGVARLDDDGLFPACSSALGSTGSTAHAVVICQN